jgi:hypothetical protein
LLLIRATSYSFYSSVTAHCKGERRSPDRKPFPLPYGLRNPYRNLKSENSQDYPQKPQYRRTRKSHSILVGVGTGIPFCWQMKEKPLLAPQKENRLRERTGM